MANILNQKEEVIKLELTKHGRKKLATGHFKPKYYYFFDDSIIYDNEYYQISDVDQPQDRILHKSLTFSNFNLLEDTLTSPLGTSDIFSDYAPSWDIKFLNGKIKNQISEQSSFYKKIFNLEEIVYKVQLKTENYIETIDVKDDYILIDLKELNVDDDVKNFEVELVVFDKIAGGKNAGLERQLIFQNQLNNIIDDIIYDDNELPANFYDIQLTKNDVNFYLDILVDDEIDQGFIYQRQKTLQEKFKTIYSTTDVPDPKAPCFDEEPKCE